MKILSPAISRLARLRMNKIEHWMQHPIEAQRDVLQQLITDGQYTEYGRKYNFSNTFKLTDFKSVVPITTYESLKPYIDRMVNGEPNVLWNTPIEWFAKSSGTTSDRSKYIPVSEESLNENHFAGNKDVLTLYYANYPDSDLLTGKGLVIGGSHKINILNDDINSGDLSAILMQNAPIWSEWIRTPELSIALLDEWENKIEQLALSTMYENVTSISGVPTWTLVLFKRILEISGKSCIKEVWPSLELYMHGGVSFIPYKKQFEAIIGGPVRYLEMYNASEGFFAGMSHEDDNGMLLYLNHSIFYEFMPVDEYGKENPKTIGLAEVQIGKNYAPVITTTGGLWRYLIGDTIQFTELYPFRVKVSGRLKHYINAFGEEVIIENTDTALARACEKHNAIVKDYSAAPVYFSDNGNGAHEWLIEFEKEPLNIEAFRYDLDNNIREVNSDYDAKRHKDIALTCLKLNVMAKNTFSNWLRHKGKLGGQHKVPRLSNDRAIIEDVLTFANNYKPVT